MPRQSAATLKVDVKQAVELAFQSVKDLFRHEQLTNLGLEEIASDDKAWRITVGFSRPWDYPTPPSPSILDRMNAANVLFEPGPTSIPEREYKVVKIDALTGELLGVEMRGT